jgi:hypothetical protein
LPALIVRTPSAPPSSASATGGFSWSCVHSPLKLLPTICKILPIKIDGLYYSVDRFGDHFLAIIPQRSIRDHPAIPPLAVQPVNADRPAHFVMGLEAWFDATPGYAVADCDWAHSGTNPDS